MIKLIALIEINRRINLVRQPVAERVLCHTGMWLSKDALSYRLSHKENTSVDFEKSNLLDQDYIRSILRFYRSALGS